MVIYLQTISIDALLLLLLVSLMSICITKATSTLSLINNDNNNEMKRADECKLKFVRLVSFVLSQ
jgi:hypothetical protein